MIINEVWLQNNMKLFGNDTTVGWFAFVLFLSHYETELANLWQERFLAPCHVAEPLFCPLPQKPRHEHVQNLWQGRFLAPCHVAEPLFCPLPQKPGHEQVQNCGKSDFCSVSTWQSHFFAPCHRNHCTDSRKTCGWRADNKQKTYIKTTKRCFYKAPFFVIMKHY